MAAGKFDRRLELESPSTSVSASGGVETIWIRTGYAWAELVSAGGGESTGDDQVTAVQQAVFRIRYRAGITPAMRVVYRGRPYEINDVRESERNRELELRCTALNVQSGNS